MKKTNQFVMHVVQTYNNGNKVTGHLIIDAKTFDEAKVNVEEKCRELNGKVLNLTYTPLGTGIGWKSAAGVDGKRRKTNDDKRDQVNYRAFTSPIRREVRNTKTHP